MDKEKQLISQAKKGSKQAFQELVEKNKEKIFFLALKLTGNLQEAEDVAGETFLIAFKNLRNFKGNSAFSTWLYRICFNIVFHLREKNKKVFPLLDEEGKDIEIPSSLSLPPEKLEQKERITLVRKCIAKLPSDFRDMILLREFEGLSYIELSDVFNCSVGTIMSKLHRARKKLKKLLIKEGFEF